jgi:4-amino-4-deoxychorismate lyase
MYRFLETFRITGGRIDNFGWHAGRIRRTLKSFYGSTGQLPAWSTGFEQGHETLFRQVLTGAPDEICKGRFCYGLEPGPLTLEPYRKRVVGHLYAIQPETLPDYRFKFLDRAALTALQDMAGADGEVLILDEKGRLTDTSYTNILLFDGKRYMTPSSPLLEGTCRSRLLAEGVIVEDILYGKDIKHFREIHLINALLGPGDLVIPVSSIIS